MMNLLRDIRANIQYVKSKSREDGKVSFRPMAEIVLLVEQPEYTYTNEEEIIRSRKIEELRFCVSSNHLDGLIEALESFQEKLSDDVVISDDAK